MPRSDVKHLRREPAPLCGTSHFRRAFVPDLCVRRVSDSRQTKGVHAPGRSDFSYSSSILFAIATIAGASSGRAVLMVILGVCSRQS